MMKSRFLHSVRAVLFPERCPYCKQLVEPHEIACADCLDLLRRTHLAIRRGALGYRCVASFAYSNAVRRAIINIKFYGRTQYIPQLAVILAEDIRSAYGDGCFDFITAVPMHEHDRRERGYNQSVLLAKALSERLGLPYLDTLKKTKRTKKQHRLTYSERKTNLSGAFALIDREAVRGRRILLVDDIITSGCTLGTCAKALNKGRPALICCAAVAAAQFQNDENVL